MVLCTLYCTVLYSLRSLEKSYNIPYNIPSHLLTPRRTPKTQPCARHLVACGAVSAHAGRGRHRRCWVGTTSWALGRGGEGRGFKRRWDRHVRRHRKSTKVVPQHTLRAHTDFFISSVMAKHFFKSGRYPHETRALGRRMPTHSVRRNYRQ